MTWFHTEKEIRQMELHRIEREKPPEPVKPVAVPVPVDPVKEAENKRIWDLVIQSARGT